MKIERKEIEQIAALARLELSEEEVASLTQDLAMILEHVRELTAAATDDVPAISGASEHTAPMRPDEPGADTLHLSLGEIAPALREGFFTVPRLAALDADALPGAGAA